MSLMINSEISKQFLLEEDAIEGFRKAVANNQCLYGRFPSFDGRT